MDFGEESTTQGCVSLLAARFYKVIKSSGQKGIFLKSQSESRGEGAGRRMAACSSKSKCPGMDTLAASESGASQKEQWLRGMASSLSGVRTRCQTTAFWVETGRKGCSENTGALVRSRCGPTGRDPLVTIVHHKHKALVLGHGHRVGLPQGQFPVCVGEKRDGRNDAGLMGEEPFGLL